MGVDLGGWELTREETYSVDERVASRKCVREGRRTLREGTLTGSMMQQNGKWSSLSDGLTRPGSLAERDTGLPKRRHLRVSTGKTSMVESLGQSSSGHS